jgi:branched-chain amino acid transport system substrate-binding protein
MVSAARVYDAGHLAAVATTPSSPDLTGISPWVFRMIPSDSVSGLLLANFASSLASRLGRPVRAAILYENDAYGRGLAESFRHNFQGDVISNDPVGRGGDLEPYVTFYKLKRPDVVFVASIEDIGIPFLHEARRQHLDAMFLGGDGWQGVATDSAAEGVYVGVPFTTQRTDTATQRFMTTFRTRFGELPEAHAALAYDATKLVARAIAAAGADRRRVREYLSGVTGVHAFQGVSGTIRFTTLNDPVGDNFHITRVQHGLLVPVEAP